MQHQRTREELSSSQMVSLPKTPLEGQTRDFLAGAGHFRPLIFTDIHLNSFRQKPGDIQLWHLVQLFQLPLVFHVLISWFRAF